MAQVSGISAVMIYANDPEKLAGWYEDQLGIKISEPGADGNYYGEVRDSATDVTIQFAICRACEELPCRGRAMMINYRVDHLDELMSDLTAAGVNIDRVVEDDYGKFAYIRDPEGNPIELWADPGI